MTAINPYSVLKIESEVTDLIYSQHPTEVSLCERLLSSYLNGFSTLPPISDSIGLRTVLLLLTTRGFNSLWSSFHLFRKGYYSQSIILTRSALEDWLIGEDCRNNPGTLNLLLEGKDEFWRREFKFHQMAKRLPEQIAESWKSIYDSMSSIAHPRTPSLTMLFTPSKDIRLGPYYDKYHFLKSYQVWLVAVSLLPEALFSVMESEAEDWWQTYSPLYATTLPEIESVKKQLDNWNP
ncbi:MAG: hypothetical protein PHW65_02360 [Dehalococcoidales bacterium]|jgi:hypothetical protein|nr:hypothetical protein [Dehalococcoidales bacterium]